MAVVFVHGINKKAGSTDVIRKTFLAAADNLSWLKENDLVLVKPAINSCQPYPATTDAVTLKTVSEILVERGARVIIGDQSGIGHVMHTREGVRYGSTRRNFGKAGFVLPHKAEFVAFEEKGWDKGFYHFQSPGTSSWDDGFYLTTFVRDADHIISLPRLSTHIQTGVTLGFKNWVGILREDSRMVFHNEGPFSDFLPRKFFGIGKSRHRRFFEKITEITLAVKDKLRLTLFTATRAQTTFGPDAVMKGVVPAFTMEPETGLVIASSDPVAAEMAALAFLRHLISLTPPLPKALGKSVYFVNRRIRDPEKENVRDNPFIRHALNLRIGSDKFAYRFDSVPEEYRSVFKSCL